MSIELRHLRVLVTVDEERSFTAAADRLRMSQAAVSRSLAALEHEVGATLMHRTTRRVEPTEQGTALSKDVWLLAIGAALTVDGLTDRRSKRRKSKAKAKGGD